MGLDLEMGVSSKATQCYACANGTPHTNTRLCSWCSMGKAVMMIAMVLVGLGSFSLLQPRRRRLMDWIGNTKCEFDPKERDAHEERRCGSCGLRCTLQSAFDAVACGICGCRCSVYDWCLFANFVENSPFCGITCCDGACCQEQKASFSFTGEIPKFKEVEAMDDYEKEKSRQKRALRRALYLAAYDKDAPKQLQVTLDVFENRTEWKDKKEVSFFGTEEQIRKAEAELRKHFPDTVSANLCSEQCCSICLGNFNLFEIGCFGWGCTCNLFQFCFDCTYAAFEDKDGWGCGLEHCFCQGVGYPGHLKDRFCSGTVGVQE